MAQSLDRRVVALEKTAPPAKRRPEGLSTEEFLSSPEFLASISDGTIDDLLAWVEVMTNEDLKALSADIAAIEAKRAHQ